ncbi:AAA family ATPase [Fusibacter sp. JL216-2]|uniref:AAA family ATPase n=1 Tax=Fusibacter sp. JL216-2 TaxID=3071453 RepID=UPI003D3390BC
MKLLKFIGKQIHGYIDVDISFNDDISILIGGNGSGKTTALKLMQALISPSFEELITIDFKFISLEFIHRKSSASIECRKDDEYIRLRSSQTEEELIIDNIDNSEYEYLLNNDSNLLQEKIQELPLKYRRHPVIEYIVKLSSPIFLGLERRIEISDIDERKLYRNKPIYSESYSKAAMNRRLYSGNLSSSLYDAQVLISDFYRKLKRRDDANLLKMKEELLLSSFKYREFDMIAFDQSMKNWNRKRDLLNKKDEVLEVLAKIEGERTVLTKELALFFDRIEKLLQSENTKEDDINLELIINMTQIDKIFELLDIVQKHKETTDRMYSNINNFIHIINKFFIDSDKTIELDSLGKIIIRRPNRKSCPVTSLSSGERQLLVIFAHAFFNKYNANEKVFIIDEPELSLHLRWQQIFIETIVENCPKTQFVMATHSPDIVDDYEEMVNNEWRC